MNEKVLAIARLAVSLLAAVAAALGIYLDADALFVGVVCALALAAFVYAWWKNNNLTDAATMAQKYLDALKEGLKDGETYES